MKMKIVSAMLAMSMLFINTSSVFAELGEVAMPPPPAENPTVTAPVVPPPEPAPTPVESTPTPATPEAHSTPTANTEIVTQTVTIPADNVGPVISGLTNLSLATHNVTIVWTTDEFAVSTLEYGATESYGTHPTLDATALLAHTAILTGLTPGTTYHYCIHATDLTGNVANSCGHSFTTASQTVVVDTTPPDVTLITVTPITTTSATINWTTSQVGNTRVEYGTTAGYGQSSPLDANLALTHTVTLSSLTPNTLYHYSIYSSDELGNETITSDETFTTHSTNSSHADSLVETEAQVNTPEPTTANAPSVSAGASLIISGIDTESIAMSTATITWHTDLPSDSQIEYGDSENFGFLTTLSSTLTTSHRVTVTGLTPNTNYIFRVKSKPVGATVATISNNNEFNTLNHSIPVVASANIISVSSGSVTGTEATISWTTDKAATSQVEYGLSTNYGTASLESATMQTSHSVALTGLEPSATYHFRVKSADEVSNITFSKDYTFTTGAGSAPSSVPTTITTLTIGGEDNASAELIWRVGSANTDLSQEYDIRYSTSPITGENIGIATPSQPTPVFYGDLSPSGAVRAYIVAGLNPNTTYYFAIRSKYESTAYSDISNVVQIKTTSGASINNESPEELALEEIENANLGGEHSPSVVSEYGSGSGGGSGGSSLSSFVPTLLKAEPADSQIIFEWNNPGEPNFVRTVIVKKEGSYPTSPSDGRTLYEGRGETFTDTNLENGKTYYYAVYSYNHAKIYSSAIRVSVAPNANNKQIKFNESGSLASSTPNFHFVRTWKYGDKDIEIEHLQELLVVDSDSYPEKYVTGYFGSLTRAALKRFQAKYRLPQTGLVDIATQKELNIVSQSETKLNVPTDYVVFNTNLKRGDQGEAVKDLQQYLIYEGSYIEAIVSGYFGNYTFGAVKKFQSKYGISPVSGFVGYKTRHKMQQLVGL